MGHYDRVVAVGGQFCRGRRKQIVAINHAVLGFGFDECCHTVGQSHGQSGTAIRLYLSEESPEDERIRSIVSRTSVTGTNARPRKRGRWY